MASEPKKLSDAESSKDEEQAYDPLVGLKQLRDEFDRLLNDREQHNTIRATLLVNFGDTKHNRHGFKIEDKGRPTVRLLVDVLQGLESESEQLRAERGALVSTLVAYEHWEADLFRDSSCWQDSLPRMSQSLYDRWMELQAERNRVLGRTAAAAALEE